MWMRPVACRELIVTHVATSSVCTMRKRHEPMKDAIPSASCSPNVACSWWRMLTGCLWESAAYLRRRLAVASEAFVVSLLRFDTEGRGCSGYSHDGDICLRTGG